MRKKLQKLEKIGKSVLSMVGRAKPPQEKPIVGSYVKELLAKATNFETGDNPPE